MYMLLVFLLEAHRYPVSIVLIGSLLVAAFVITLIIALDYRTWPKPSKKAIVPKERADSLWNRQVGQGGCIAFIMSMMLLISMLSAVLIADGILD